MMGPKEPGSVPGMSGILVRLSEDDYLSIADHAERDGTSLSGYVRTLIRRHLETLAVAA